MSINSSQLDFSDSDAQVESDSFTPIKPLYSTESEDSFSKEAEIHLNINPAERDNQSSIPFENSKKSELKSTKG